MQSYLRLVCPLSIDSMFHSSVVPNSQTFQDDSTLHLYVFYLFDALVCTNWRDFFCDTALTVAGGNVFVALAPVSTSATALANETLVTALAYRSDRPPTATCNYLFIFFSVGQCRSSSYKRTGDKCCLGFV